MLKIKAKKLHNDAVLPKFAHITDAGADLTATSIEYKDDLVIYGIGLAFEIPEGYYMQLCPRSSIYKYDLELVNSVGIVDADYRNEVKFIFRRVYYMMSDIMSEKMYEVGDRIGQAIIRKIEPTEYIEVDELNETIRGMGGFGSTDK